MLNTSKWIRPGACLGSVCPTYSRSFSVEKQVISASLHITAMGVYRVILNEKTISNAVMMPGWTSYHARLQYQTYDITSMVEKNNLISVSVGPGWYRSYLANWLELPQEEQTRLRESPLGLLAKVELHFLDGTELVIPTNSEWNVSTSMIHFSDLYDGEVADATATPKNLGAALEFDGPACELIPMQGEWVREQERVKPARILRTPRGETVVDFGQNLTGYVELKLQARAGDLVTLSHAEVLDRDGNFYTDNYRLAKAKLQYICRDGNQTYHPWFTFFGFRYVRLDDFPGNVVPENLTAVVVHSDMKRTGTVRSSDPLLNQLFDNILWGLKSNFLDVPTDCPQRNERLGWTGDAQVFVKTACYLYDVERFFTKWLADMALDQLPNGSIPHVIPAIPWLNSGSAAWADAAVICPWQIYQFYGNTAILRNQFACMKGHLDYIASASTEPYLWVGDEHFGDWLGIDSPPGSYKGASNEDLIASAFYAHSTSLVIKTGKILGEDVTMYEKLYDKIVTRFREFFPIYKTQTEMVLAVHFNLAENLQFTADRLAKSIHDAGIQLQTGFVGTPYLLHVLSAYGHTDLAYKLLLRKEYPSWLYPVTKGATTVWEHWDGLKPDGSMWSADMNSFNHYAYGAVLDWIYEKAAGIQVIEDAPGFTRVRIAPQASHRLDWLEASVETRNGLVRSCWYHRDGMVRHHISVPVSADVYLNGNEYHLEPGNYVFFVDAYYSVE